MRTMIKLKSARRTVRRANVADSRRRPQEGLKFTRVFSQKAIAPFDEIEWEQRTAEITDDSGKAIFKQENVEVPKSWSAAGDEDRRLEIFLRRHRQRHRPVQGRPRALA